MKQIIILQFAVLSVCSLVSLVIWGYSGFLSAIGGGLSYLLPTLVAVLLLKLFSGDPFLQSRMYIFGEIFKSSAVAVVHVRHVFNMASIAGVCPVF